MAFLSRGGGGGYYITDEKNWWFLMELKIWNNGSKLFEKKWWMNQKYIGACSLKRIGIG